MSRGVDIAGLSRRFPGADRDAVSNVTLSVGRAETLCLVGPSGCGKSTTLRIVAGLETPDRGDVAIDGKSMIGVPPQDRDVAMVFQGFALYPHLAVRDILAFPLRMRRVARSERGRLVSETAELLGITRLLDRRPAQLSGGEQQRVAMGRAIVRRPKAFLFDEPLSNLDAALRADLRVELARLLRRLEATALYVTHDQVEAMTLGHRIAVMNGGRLEQLDTPRAIYERPATVFVAGFFGTPPMNLLDAHKDGDTARAGAFGLPSPAGAPDELILGVRPEHVTLDGAPGAPGTAGVAAAVVVAVEPLGAESHVELTVGGHVLRARVPGFTKLAPGQEVTCSLEPHGVRWFARSSGRAL